MRLHADLVPSPVAPLLVAVDGDGALRRLSFVRRRSRAAIEGELSAGGREVEWSAGRCRDVARQLREYFRGQRRAFELELAPEGTAFQRAVWEALRAIPYGRTASYGDVARAVRRPRAFRAVGQANHANPIAVVIPCHRVIAADGRLGGFGGGLGVKRALLELERGAVAARAVSA